MADLASLIEELRKELKDQSKAVEASREDVNIREQAWQEARGKEKPARESAWQAALKREEAAVREGEQIRQNLQTLFEKLPSAGEQVTSLKVLLVCQTFTLLVTAAHLQLMQQVKRRLLVSGNQYIL